MVVHDERYHVARLHRIVRHGREDCQRDGQRRLRMGMPERLEPRARKLRESDRRDRDDVGWVKTRAGQGELPEMTARGELGSLIDPLGVNPLISGGRGNRGGGFHHGPYQGNLPYRSQPNAYQGARSIRVMARVAF